MAELVFPDPNIPLTAGQIIFLGGLLGYEIRNVSEVDKRIADYGVAPVYYKGRDAYANNRPTRVAEDPKVIELFDIVRKETTLVWLRPKLGSLGKFVVVKTPERMRFKKFMPYIKFGLFIRPVPKDLYTAVLQMGENCDIELHAIAYAREVRQQKVFEKIVREELGLPDETEIIRTEMKALRESLKEMIREIVAKTMEELAEQMFMLMKESKPPRRRKILYGRITTELLKMPGVYKVDWSDDVVIVYCNKNVLDSVKKKVAEFGGKVIDVYESRFLGIVKADFGGGE